MEGFLFTTTNNTSADPFKMIKKNNYLVFYGYLWSTLTILPSISFLLTYSSCTAWNMLSWSRVVGILLGVTTATNSQFEEFSNSSFLLFLLLLPSPSSESTWSSLLSSSFVLLSNDSGLLGSSSDFFDEFGVSAVIEELEDEEERCGLLFGDVESRSRSEVEQGARSSAENRIK